VDAANVETMMREALAEARRQARPVSIRSAPPSRRTCRIVFAHPDPAVQAAEIIERVPYVRSHIETYLGGILRDESRALFERYEPRMLDWLDDKVRRHRQPQPPD
jgi:hypothetical protein